MSGEVQAVYMDKSLKANYCQRVNKAAEKMCTHSNSRYTLYMGFYVYYKHVHINKKIITSTATTYIVCNQRNVINYKYLLEK